MSRHLASSAVPGSRGTAGGWDCSRPPRSRAASLSPVRRHRRAAAPDRRAGIEPCRQLHRDLIPGAAARFRRRKSRGLDRVDMLDGFLAGNPSTCPAKELPAIRNFHRSAVAIGHREPQPTVSGLRVWNTLQSLTSTEYRDPLNLDQHFRTCETSDGNQRARRKIIAEDLLS